MLSASLSPLLLLLLPSSSSSSSRTRFESLGNGGAGAFVFGLGARRAARVDAGSVAARGDVERAGDLLTAAGERSADEDDDDAIAVAGPGRFLDNGTLAELESDASGVVSALSPILGLGRLEALVERVRSGDVPSSSESERRC